MVLDSRLPPGVYNYSAMSRTNRNNHNPPTIRSVNDVSATAQALYRDHLQDWYDPPVYTGIEDLLWNDLVIENPELDFFDEVMSMTERNEEEREIWNSFNSAVDGRDFSLTNRVSLSEDTIMKHMKTRPVAEDDHDDKICVVCQDRLFLEDQDKIAILDCGHEYHAGCIKKWLMKKNSCPLCNATGVSAD